MKSKFPGYYKLTEKEFKSLWRDCLFVVDTNVLLNLYRYPISAREDLFNVFENIQDRVWLPYHVAVEFQRNRPLVIAEQRRKFNDVKKILEDFPSNLKKEFESRQIHTRHALIEPDKFLSEISDSCLKFEQELTNWETKQFGAHEHDPLRDRIDKLFGTNVGNKPDEKWITRVQHDGEIRFKNQQPPGYMDAQKARNEPEISTYGGIISDSQFGDLLIWEEIIDHLNKSDAKCAVFITDDLKEDWWWIVNDGGKKTLGPRPELISEIIQRTPIDTFHMYKSEQFLTHAQKYIETTIDPISADSIKEISISLEKLVNSNLPLNKSNRGNQQSGAHSKEDGDKTVFYIGDRVFHKKFGVGEVQDIEGDKLTIAFEKAGEKRMLDSFVERH